MGGCPRTVCDIYPAGSNESLERCFQLMETGDRNLLDRWIENWSDLVEFEVYPVMSSNEAADKVAPRL